MQKKRMSKDKNQSMSQVRVCSLKKRSICIHYHRETSNASPIKMKIHEGQAGDDVTLQLSRVHIC